jgi:hypothetical protein
MEYRLLGRSSLKVSVFSFGAMTFGGAGMFASVGDTKGAEAKRQIDMCLEAGVNLFDTADMYSDGQSEELLADALGARRPQVLIATKFFGRTGRGVNDLGASRHHILEACEASLRRLKTNYSADLGAAGVRLSPGQVQAYSRRRPYPTGYRWAACEQEYRAVAPRSRHAGRNCRGPHRDHGFAGR